MKIKLRTSLRREGEICEEKKTMKKGRKFKERKSNENEMKRRERNTEQMGRNGLRTLPIRRQSDVMK